MVGDLKSCPGGFEADVFTDGRWLVKLWRQHSDSNTSLALTAELATHHLPVPAACRAFDGSYTAAYTIEHDSRRFALFPFVSGSAASWTDTEVIAQAIRAVHTVAGLALPRADLTEECINDLRNRQHHPWVADRGRELMTAVDRLEAVIDRCRSIDVPHVVCHRDLFPHNVLVDGNGHLTALLDWGSVQSAPREHDLFVGLCGPDPVRFLQAYDTKDLNLAHLEYARLARSLRDLAARLVAEVDQDGINTWGFDGLRRVDHDLALARPFFAS